MTEPRWVLFVTTDDAVNDVADRLADLPMQDFTVWDREPFDRSLQCWCQGVMRSHDWKPGSPCPSERVFLADAGPNSR